MILGYYLKYKLKMDLKEYGVQKLKLKKFNIRPG